MSNVISIKNLIYTYDWHNKFNHHYKICSYRFTTEEVTKKVESYRSMLMGTEMKTSAPRDEFGRIK